MKDQKKLRIPQEIIDGLVTYFDIASTVGRYLKLTKQGKEYVALCPFHKESSPSFSVSTSKQFYYCFGCGAGGNSLDFLQNYLGKSFISIIQEMAQENNVDLTPYLKTSQNSAAELKLLPAMKKAMMYFMENLSSNGSSNSAMKYLSDRKISDAAIKRFSLGYAKPNYEIINDLKDIQDEMILGGIFGENEADKRVYTNFRDRIIMPIRDIRGKFIGLSGRSMNDADMPKYKNSKESVLFSRNSALYGLYESCETFGTDRLDRIDVVEGQFDVIALWSIGRPACAAMGSSMSAHQLRLLLRHSKHITFMFDGDTAGIKAMIRVCSLLLEHITDHEHVIEVVILQKGEDPDSLIRNDIDAFNEKISRPENWIDALLTNIEEYKKMDGNQGRAEYASRCVEIIHETRDPLLRYQAIERASFYCGFPVETMQEKLLSLPLLRSGQAMKITQDKSYNEVSINLARMLWDDPSLSLKISHPDLWSEVGDALIKIIAAWVVDIKSGKFDNQFSDAEMKIMIDNPELMLETENKSRWRVAGSAFGRILKDSEMPGLMETIMSEEPDESESIALSYINHTTGTCASLAMQEISNKAKNSTMTEVDRDRFKELLVIRVGCSNKLK